MRIESDYKVIACFIVTMTILTIHVSNVYAIDFVDHTGYTPSWAQSLGSYQALDRCNGIVGENNADGNWCMEWIGSVIDQGNSTQSFRPATNMTERDCTANIVCVFTDEFVKYAGTYYDLFEHQYRPSFATAYFGQSIENNKISVYLTSMGETPSTDILDMQTGTLSNDQYNYSDKGFDYVESLPVKTSLYKDHDMCGFGGCKITFEKMDVKGTTRTILVSHLDNGDGTFLENRYDNDTGVWLAGIQTVKDNGQIFTNELHIVDSNIYDHPTVIIAFNVQPESITGIPDQARTITKSWVEGSITDNEFLQKIQLLLDNGQMVIPYPSSQEWNSMKMLQGDWMHIAKDVLSPWAEGVSDKSNGVIETFQDLIGTKYLTEKSWENKLSMNSTIQTTQQSNPSTNSKDSAYTVGYTIGPFLFFGIPVIIIFVIVWKLRKYLAKRRNNKLQKRM